MCICTRDSASRRAGCAWEFARAAGVHLHVGLCVITPHRVPVWGWVCTCTWGRACTGTGCAHAKPWAVLALAVCSHGNVLARGLGVHLHAGGGLHGAVHAHAALRAMHKSTKLAQKLICTRAERGFAHRSVFARGCVLTVHGTSVFARGCVCLHGAVPPQGATHHPIAPVRAPCTRPCTRAASPRPGTRLPLARGICTRRLARGCPCTSVAAGHRRRGAHERCACALARALHRALCASVFTGGGVQAPSTRV